MNRKLIADIFYILITFVWLPVVFWGAFFYAPPIIGLGDTGKIIFFHVPCSWIAVFAFLISALYSARILYQLNKDTTHLQSYDVWALSAAQVGFIFTILATVTGSIWANQIWHDPWNWDPREISIFILLIIYAAYFALRSAINSEHDKIRLAAVYSIFAFFTVPFFVFIIPRVYQGLHPDTIISNSGDINLDSDFRVRLIFFSSLFGFTVFFWYLLKIRVKLQLLINKKEELLEDIDE